MGVQIGIPFDTSADGSFHKVSRFPLEPWDNLGIFIRPVSTALKRLLQEAKDVSHSEKPGLYGG